MLTEVIYKPAIKLGKPYQMLQAALTYYHSTGQHKVAKELVIKMWCCVSKEEQLRLLKQYATIMED